MEAFPSVFCIIDTETTGMRAEFSRIIDIAIIRVENGKVVKRYETLLNPRVSIPSFITTITGLSDEDLLCAPTFEEVALEIQEVLSGAVFVAHNVSFDYSFVQKEFSRTGIEYRAPKLCSVNLSRKIFPKVKGHSLDAIIERFNISVKNRHRAMPDAGAVLSFFKKISRSVDKDLLALTVKEVIDIFSPRTSAENLPDGPGVYFFYGQNQELLYVGKSKHLRTRVRSHFHKSSLYKENKIQNTTARIETVSTSGELSALLLEASLIKSESPLYNRALTRKKKLIIAKKALTKEGFSHVVLETVTEISPSQEILGVYRTIYQAKKKLEEIGSTYKICEKLLGVDTNQEACFNYQLKKCDGACVGKIDKETHNNRLDEAFQKRRIKVWPFKGVVSISENKNENCGTVFFIDNWVLINSFSFENGSYEKFSDHGGSFEYDTYKILARYLLDAKNKKDIKVISRDEYKQQLSFMTGSYEDVCYIT